MLSAWQLRAVEAIRRFAIERPGTLFLVLLAMNALSRPVSVTAHDARLYSLQALNAAEHGAYADDLFLRYGSQDQLSLFSRIIGPMVALLGLRIAFFVCYFVFNALFVLAAFRLVRALIDDAAIATFVLVFLVTAPLPYGGQGIFLVHEQFFTPRMVAVPLTLFAVERLFKLRFLAAFALLAAATMVHPLMAFGGVMIGVGLLAATYLPPRVCLAMLGVATVAGLMVMFTPMLGTKLFGTMDEDWHERLRISVPYNYPDMWGVLDWLNVGVSFALMIIAATTLYRDDPVRRRFFLVVAIAGIVGFSATLAASMSSYALLFQAQPYRVMWILKVLQIPLAFVVIARWSEAPTLLARLAALALVGFYCNTHALEPELKIILTMTALSLLLAKLTTSSPEENWLWYGSARGLVLGALGWMAYRWWFFANNRAVFTQHFDLNEFFVLDIGSPILWLVGMTILASWQPLDVRALRWSALATALLAPIVFFLPEGSSDYRREHTRLGADMAFVREIVEHGSITHPTIYAPFNRPDLLWIDVGANSYFDILQTAGILFQRDTAIEVERRAPLVGKFEMHLQRGRTVFLGDAKKHGYEILFKTPFDGPPPTSDDLVRLCAEPTLDYVVLPHEFAGLYAATNGRVYVYDCAKLRTLLLSGSR